MAEQSFDINFRGYWRDSKKSSVPSKSGIYCVYRAVYDENKEFLSLKELIYIGESEDVKGRLANHEKLDVWSKRLKGEEVLCYSFGEVSPKDRVRCEAALIFKHKPPVNTEYAEAFPHDKTSISLEGRIGFLNESFTVLRT
ncbi:GIY-YIG nuclease family protein [Chromobacterium piscinae]|uniref:GIY-YIG nuclease family protein n=1 Tax=Chromobacterium piscinae TaxID=686831 RepID=UPI001E4A475C|nr:GIY-YIG nuclease family protein [Chromobacterium piscinae]MCD4504785.1 GIY-YIG nuclease family protein [Chromobacterium piscinae]